MASNPDKAAPRARRWWLAACVAAAVGLAAIILSDYGLQVWTAILLVVLLLCPLLLVWGMVQARSPAVLVVGPVPETRGVLIDWLAPIYDPMCRAVGAGPALRRRTLALAELRPGQRVLDVGCGTGVLTRLAAEAVGPEGVAVGIDPGPAMIGIARDKAERRHSRARFDLGVAEALAFRDDTFDAVLSSFMLHHLPGDLKAAAVGEMRRVLKPGGRLVMVDFDIARPIARAIFAILRLLPGTAHVLHAAGDPVPLLHEAGFADVATAGGWRATASFWRGRKPGT